MSQPFLYVVNGGGKCLKEFNVQEHGNKPVSALISGISI